MLEPGYIGIEEAKKIFRGDSDVFRFSEGILQMPDGNGGWKKVSREYSQQHRGIEAAVLDLLLHHYPDLPILSLSGAIDTQEALMDKMKDSIGELADASNYSLDHLLGALNFTLTDVLVKLEGGDYRLALDKTLDSLQDNEVLFTHFDKDESDRNRHFREAIISARNIVGVELEYPEDGTIAQLGNEWPEAVRFIEQHRTKFETLWKAKKEFKPRHSFETVRELRDSDAFVESARIQIHLSNGVIHEIKQSLIGEGKARKASA